jgi:hydrogenase expression/formation protein HypE
MTQLPIGKVGSDVFADVILQRLGAEDPEVVVGPRHGVDFGVVKVAPGVVMALTADPVFVVPAYGWERAAWFAVHILASDAALSGLPLRWMSVDLNLPRALSDSDLGRLWEAYAHTCEMLGIAIVTGHTGRYDGCEWPMVGGATCITIGPEDAYVTPAMVQPGDQIVVTKGAAIEATALFAATFPDRVRTGVGNDVWQAADALFEQMTVVPETRVAAETGLRRNGVTAMHDATEGGVLGGLAELAAAADVGLRIALEAIPVPTEARAVCNLVGINPYTSISEGTLIAGVTPAHTDRFLRGLADLGVAAAVVGEATPPGAGAVLEADGEARPLRHPGADPFWEAFGRWAGEAGDADPAGAPSARA